MLPELPKTYWLLSLFRIISVFIPQFGYIHPDEYFQSIEILAGKTFELESNPPWEFDATAPIRSVTLSYFTIGFSYQILKLINTSLQYFTLLPPIVTSYTLVVAPRFVLTLLSFVIDFSLYKICVTNNEKYKTKLIILASSYVTLTYGTRTFSNSLESILFALLLYYVAESLIFSNILLKKREYLNYRCDTSRTIVEKVKFHRLKSYLGSDSVRNCLEIGTITVFGFFNRPTFLLYAVFPIFFWLYRGIGNKLIVPLTFHLRIIVLLICALPAVLLHVLLDSFFYSYITWGEIGVLSVSINNFVFTPLNFIRYNVEARNLAKHGLHPRYVHFFVNLPLLFNVLAVLGLYALAEALYNLSKGKTQNLPTVRSVRGLMMVAYLTPLSLLSIFPHQEPRFLTPVILPLVYLFGSTVMPESDKILIKLDNRNFQPKTNTRTNSKFLLHIWIIFNTILFCFYGFIHQGGLFNSIEWLAKEMQITPRTTEYHILTNHLYSLPESLFLQKSTNKLFFAKTTKYSIDKRVYLYETGSMEVGKFNHVIEEIQAIVLTKKRDLKPNKKFKLLILIPGVLQDRFTFLHNIKTNSSLILRQSFYPHLSTETLNHFISTILFYYTQFSIDSYKLYLSKFINSFSLQLYEIIIE